MTEQEFKQLFESKLGSREVPFDASSWTAMEGMLDAKAQSMSYYWKAASVLAITFTLGIGAGVWNWQEAKNEQQLVNESIENTINIPVQKSIESEAQTPDYNASEVIANKEVQIIETEALSEKNRSPKETNQQPKAKLNKQLLGALNTDKIGEAPSSKQEGLKENIENEPMGSPLEVSYVSDDVFDNYFLRNKNPFAKIPALKRAENVNMEDSYVQAPDLSEESTEVFTEKALDKFKKKNEFYFQGAFLSSDAFNSDEQANGFGIGLGVRHRIDQKWSVVTELNYVQRSQPGIAVHTDSVLFGFGKEELHSTLEVTKLQSFEIPLILEFSGNKHQIGFGAYASYIFTTTSDLTRTKISFKGEESAQTKELTGDSPLVNNFDFGLRMSYYYQINPMLSIGASSSIGLTDITENKPMQNADFNRNIDLRLGVKYRIF